MSGFDTGFILYVGNMFGGKTASMITELEIARDHLERKVQVFKSERDTRYEPGYICAQNDKLKFPATEISDAGEIEKKLIDGVEIVGIDELQFFDRGVVDFIENYKHKIKIFGTGLWRDYRGNPFPLREVGSFHKDSEFHIGHFVGWADEINFRFPKCKHKENGRKICGAEAKYCQRVNDDGIFSGYNEDTIKVGGVKDYLARCKEHFYRPERNV